MPTEERLNEHASASSTTIDPTLADAHLAGPLHLPRYKCHKEVNAAKILCIGHRGFEAQVVLTLQVGILKEGHRFMQDVVVSREWSNKHNPESGGYYVVYEDGYTSFSPAAAFESGYTRIE